VTRSEHDFTLKIRLFYQDNRRQFAWRSDPSPYRVAVSELMLQQTQIGRVASYFDRWVERFEDFQSLAQAPTEDVLRSWQGLGYNRRALWLRDMAQRVTTQYNGELPRDPEVLVTFGGVGPNTAGSMAAFAYQWPAVFIETNIRRTFIHEFFPDAIDVHDRALLSLIEATLDRDNPRDWYYALMDYGAYLATTTRNPNRRSAHYSRQSRFMGSRREIRGQVIKQLLEGPRAMREFGISDGRLDLVLATLCEEGFARFQDGRYEIP